MKSIGNVITEMRNALHDIVFAFFIFSLLLLIGNDQFNRIHNEIENIHNHLWRQ
jgi:hypothetical protein